MKAATHRTRILDASAFAGIAAGTALLLPAMLVPELSFLAALAFVVLVPSLLYELR